MPRIDFSYGRAPGGAATAVRGGHFLTLTPAELAGFSSAALGLGDIQYEGRDVPGLCACFDLQGFTEFCSPADSNLAVREFLGKFFDWLFAGIAAELRAPTEATGAASVALWAPLPMYCKFTGDGLLFIWNTEHCGDCASLQNLVSVLLKTTHRYRSEFLPRITVAMSRQPPARLRCGVARGHVVSVGDGSDYVGPCINMASRLQKLAALSFAVSRLGLDLDNTPVARLLVLKRTAVRGVDSAELVYVLRHEFEQLSETERAAFAEP